MDVFGCGLFLAGHAPIPFDTSEIERNECSGFLRLSNSPRDILRKKGRRVAVYSQHQPCHDPGGPSLSRRSVACGSTTLPFWTASGMDTHPTVRATVGHPADPNEGCKWRKMRAPRLDGPNPMPGIHWSPNPIFSAG